MTNWTPPRANIDLGFLQKRSEIELWSDGVKRRSQREASDIARSKFRGDQALDQAAPGGGWVGRIHSVSTVNLPPKIRGSLPI